MSSVAPTTAASSFLSIRNYIESTYGAGTFQQVREGLVARGIDDFPPVLTPAGRYPTATLMALVDIAHALLGPEDFYERCGRGIVAYEINAVFRFALRLTTPLGVLTRGGEAWRRVHSAGTWTVHAEPGSADARLTGFPSTVGYCRLLTGYFERLLTLTGARQVVLAHPRCAARGDAYCGFTASWRR